MTSQILSSELANLVNESKRKNPDLRNAADKSLQDLRSLPSTSEAQLAAGWYCLDIQLKILQALPSLIQNYSDDVRNELLSSVLQLVISTFEKVVVEDEKQLQIPTVTEVPGDDGNISVRPSANDAYKVFCDICLLTEGGKPQSIRFSAISQASGLELIEAVLSNHGSLFLTHPEQAFILRSHIMPLIIKSLSERLTFSITLRIMRVFNLILRQHLTIVPSECEMALGLLNHMLDPDAALPWKRAMCMEVFRNVYSDPNLIIQIYAQYDAQEGKKSIIRDNLAVFVRLSTEKPTLIGLGQHSTAPVNAPPEEDVLPDAQAALEAGAVGIIGGAPNLSSVPGISTQWSTLRIPCMDHLDKQEPPTLPETYIYSLVLSCINNFSESLAKFILPLTVHKEGGRKKGKKGAAQQEPPTSVSNPKTSGTETPTGFGLSIKTELHVQDYVFSLNKLGDLGTLNANRLISFDPDVSGWSLLVKALVSVASTLQLVVDSLYEGASEPEDELDETDIEVHVVVLDSLKSVLEQCGDSLQVGWNMVFLLARSVFVGFGTKIQDGASAEDVTANEAKVQSSSEMIATKLGRLSFSSVQLVCSDFLTAIPDDAIFLLLDLLYFFCDQGEDLNISLTTITYFWNVSDYLHGRADAAAMEELATKSIDAPNPEEQIQEGVQARSIPAMWLHLLERIATIAHDRRAEVRNGTLHTLLRIFDNYGDQISPASWNLCLRVIMFRLLDFDIKQHQAFRSTNADPEEAHSWVETSRIILNGLVKLFSAYPESILSAPRFSTLWESMLDYFRQYLACGSQAVNAVTYDAVAGLLSKLETAELVGEGAVQKAAQIWLDGSPTDHAEYPSTTGNHEAYLAYVRCFKEFYRLVGKDLDAEALSKVSANLRTCIVTEERDAYTSDRDILTPLQKEVLGGIKIIKTSSDGVPTIIVKLLADFAALPFGRPPPIGTRDGNTWVALSKASMDRIQHLVAEHISSTELFANGALLSALQSLVIPIRLKYEWKSLSIKEDQMIPIWQEIVAMANGIAHADPAAAPSPSVVLEDEAFDIKSLTTLRDIITPGLGASYIPDSIRRTYTSTLFHTSLIHPPSVDEIPPDFASAPPLASLYRLRHGRTRDPAPTPRSKMSYLCLRELLDLVRRRAPGAASDPQRVALARAAAPFLILRAALPLKSYIADQPLRGRMPQPASLRDELLFVLRELRALDCEPQAIPGTG
ncbi:putative endosomal peripheral membrane protein [Neofusicoccum parvum UCRNP2]|uniref:Putative endosomal peripheral membrane protein n=1 Tax=Botryosphaeria parva (strain UCR-NP2) TaxID=1287680 RepID=R1H1M6_BOTPV|nr:putative endosomal peripheral membrane protein [Neofusicoccum parvum UCRNP2]